MFLRSKKELFRAPRKRKRAKVLWGRKPLSSPLLSTAGTIECKPTPQREAKATSLNFLRSPV